MAHFAQIENNVVVDVVVVSNSDIGDLPFPASEPVGIAFLEQILPGKQWKQTSYNGTFRMRYAELGGTYNAEYDAFVSIKPYDDWIFDTDVVNWVPPVPRPSGGNWEWVQSKHEWVPVVVPVTSIG